MDTIKKAEDRFKGFLESAPDAIVIVDNDGKIQIVNFQTEQLFGFNREELIGKEVEVLMPSKFKIVHHGHRQNLLPTQKQEQWGKEWNYLVSIKTEEYFLLLSA